MNNNNRQQQRLLQDEEVEDDTYATPNERSLLTSELREAEEHELLLQAQAEAYNNEM
tara:strand:+ start:325 stop:495 length:171 start_codon:yes stop_codon:yes gene_type:complete